MATNASYDFWINSLGFNTCISKDNPLERATAQFRKDQFDAASTVGDQSLTGWWTRGQFSFHKGGGLKYYETLDGETVLNRFSNDLAVDPFSTPGEVSLTSVMSSIYSTAAIESCVDAPAWATGGILGLTSAGALKLIPSSGAAATTVTGSGSFLATDGDYFYVADGTTISSQASNPKVEAYNYVPNPGPYPDGSNHPAGWTGSANFLAAASPVLVTSYYGYPYPARYYSYAHTTGDITGDWTVLTTVTGLTVGRDYEFSMILVAQPEAFDPAGVPQLIADGTSGGDPATNDPSAPEARKSMTFRASATSVDVGFRATGGTYTDGTSVSMNQVNWSSAMVIEVPTVVTEYADGYSTGWAWQGTAKNSISERLPGASTALVSLWENEIDSNWAGCWVAKGRMFAVDEGGRWFAMSPAGGIARDNDTFWRSGRTGALTWSLADSAGAVFIAEGRDIFSLTVTDDGLLPTLGAPALAARLPVGETISAIQEYLGQLIICTTKGIRIAQLEGTQLAYGPLVVEGESQARRVAVRGNSAFVPVIVEGDPSLVELSFSDTVSDLVRPWSRFCDLGGAGTSPCGAFLSEDGYLRIFDETGVLKEGSTLASTGWLQTGYLRLGTLDPKAFRLLRVKTAGTVGSISVSVVEPDGTVTSVGTVAAGASTNLDLSSALTDPLEYIALKFTLTGSAGAGPTLVGYQLKALPVPQRQRLMRVPLLLHDHERNRTGQRVGVSGSAWTRLAALEALEESNAVVTFEDKETGETGSGYIESVEVRRTSPGSRTDEGFGGLLYVTIRKL